MHSRLSGCICACALLFLLAPACAAAQAGQQPSSTDLTCPAKISVAESASSLPGWQSETGNADRLFERISVFQVSAEGQEFDLAPDTTHRTGSIVSQVWNIAQNPSMKYMLRCRYRNTQATVKREIPAGVRACHLKYTGAANGGVSGASEMSCR